VRASITEALAQRLGRPLTDRQLSLFEFWPASIFYLPVVVRWVMLAIRHRGLTLPTLANPGIEAGGLCGESKSAILAVLDKAAPDHVARSIVLDTPVFDTASAREATSLTARALSSLRAAGLELPVVAKPDIGCKGTGVRVVRDATALAAYLGEFPAGERVVLQELVDVDGEAGIFYARRPDEATGRIISMTLKYFPEVIGDGRSTLRQLIANDRRAKLLLRIYLPRLAARLGEVPPAGQPVRLVFVGNHCKGAVFRDGSAQVTPAMVACFDRIARALPEFYFGRFDVRFSSLAGLKRGEGFKIIEVNGAGSEATHIWDKNTRLFDAYRTLFEQFDLAFEIGRMNRARGFRPTGPCALLRLFRRQQDLMSRYPLGE